MTDNPFAAPAAAGGGFSPSDHHGRLLYIEPLSAEKDIPTSYGPSDAVRADIAVIDGDDAPLEFPDSLIFPKVLQSQLRSKIGEKVLGRLGQGEAKPGQSPPWKLEPATEQDVEVGKRWLAHLEKQQAERDAKPPVNTSSASHVAKQEEAEKVSTPF